MWNRKQIELEFDGRLKLQKFAIETKKGQKIRSDDE